MPAVSYIHAHEGASLGYVVEHAPGPAWLGGMQGREFLPFDPINNQNYYVELFNRGNQPIDYTVTSDNDWIKISSGKGSFTNEEKVYVSIDWAKAPKENTAGEIVICHSGEKFRVKVPIRNNLVPASGFVENNGVVSVDAAHFTSKFDSKDIRWIVVPNLGRTGSAVTVEPANAQRQSPGSGTPYLEYEFSIFDEKPLKVETYLSPTLNYQKNEGLKYAIAINDEEPQIVNINEGETTPDWEYPEWFNKTVGDHIRKKQSVHKTYKPGKHKLRIWMIDPGVVFQKFVIDAGGLKPSYLGPPESIYLKP